MIDEIKLDVWSANVILEVFERSLGEVEGDLREAVDALREALEGNDGQDNA